MFFAYDLITKILLIKVIYLTFSDRPQEVDKLSYQVSLVIVFSQAVAVFFITYDALMLMAR